jgi:transposase
VPRYGEHAEQFLTILGVSGGWQKGRIVMEVLFPFCAGIDVHKDFVAVCRVYRDHTGKRIEEVRKFGTMTADLLELSDWLSDAGVKHACMESTGVYWQPVFNILEGDLDVWVVNAHHLKCVPGRKTDPKDARWIAQCFEHGLLNRSFVPDENQRGLRELTRTRTKFVQERTNMVNRVHKLLEPCNIKLASVATDIFGATGRAVLDALAGGETDAAKMTQLAKGQLKNKAPQLVRALEGHMTASQRLVLSELLKQIDSLNDSLGRITLAIDEAMRPFESAVETLVTIPGIGKQAAETILAETGTDMGTFPTADKFCAWAGVAPGNNQSGGKTKKAKTRSGNVYLRTILVQIARCAVRSDNYYRALYSRLVKRLGDGRAIMAVAHAILQAIYYMLSRHQNYQELGSDYYAKRDPQAIVKECMRRLNRCGFEVTLSPTEMAAAA